MASRDVYVVKGTTGFYDADGTLDIPTYGLFFAKDRAEDFVDYYATIGIDAIVKTVPWAEFKETVWDYPED